MFSRYRLPLLLLLLGLVVAGAGREIASSSEEATPDIPRQVAGLHAEGYGNNSRGGAGGKVIWVKNLKDDGRGSLRRALMTTGPRIIKFKVGGVIELKTPLTTRSGRVTIDGLSAAPHGGVTIHGGLGFRDCEDVIIRHLRLRFGYDALGIYYSRRVLVDHVSAAWSTDENIDIWHSQDVTLQWCIIAEGLYESNHPKGPHSMGSLQGNSNRVTTHHSLFAGNFDRNPRLSGEPTEGEMNSDTYQFDVINNVIYNYWQAATVSGAQVNFIGNTFRPGPDSNKGKPEIIVNPRYDTARVYCYDNSGPHRDSQDIEQTALVWIAGRNQPGEPWGIDTPGASHFFSRQPFATPPRARVETQPSGEAYELVLSRAGAWPRDREDQRLLDEVEQGEGMVGRVGPRWREILQAFRDGATQEPGSDSP